MKVVLPLWNCRGQAWSPPGAGGAWAKTRGESSMVMKSGIKTRAVHRFPWRRVISDMGPYFATLNLSPSAASLRLAPWVVLFSSMTTPF